MELTPEKVVELAGMAAQIEYDPATVADLLTQHGMTQMQWDDCMTRIAADTTMAAAFAQAKTAAAATARPAEGAPAAGGH
jgi:hypothetical protein